MKIEKRNILLVDDDPDDQLLFKEALRNVDPEVICVTAENGQKAYELLAEGIIHPDVVFMDINMSVMNGIECLKKLKESDNLNHLPVIIYSTAISEKTKEVCETLGAAAVLKKPNDFHLLCNEIMRQLKSIR